MPPFLDVSDVLLDPVFADKFTVVRRPEVVNQSGYSTVNQTVIRNVVGVVTSASPNDLERTTDSDRFRRSLWFVTKFRLFGTGRDGASRNFKPDLVLWAGDYYIVRTVEPYPRYGAGFVQCTAESIDTQDFPAGFSAPVLGQFRFNFAPNSMALNFLGRTC